MAFDLRGAWVVARTELRAYVRYVRADRRRFAATLFSVGLFAVVFPLLALVPIIDFGRRLVAGSPPIGVLGAVLTTVVIAGAYMGAAAALQQNRIGSVGPLVRTSLSPAAVVVGRFASEMLQTGVLFVPAFVAVLIGIGIGAGGPLAPFLVTAAVLPLLLVGLLVGRTIGAAGRYAGLLARLSTWAKVLVLVVIVGVVFLATQLALASFFRGSSTIAAVSVPAFLPGTPVQAYASVVFAPLGATVRPLGVLVVVVVLAAIPIGLVATVRVETALLFTGSADHEHGTDETTGVPRLLAGTPAARIAARYLLRTRRDPKMLGHLFPILIGGFAVVASFVPNPELALTLGPSAAVIGGSVLAGATYCLNPLGDDRDQLPLLLTNTRSVATLLRGRALAGVVIGLALAVGVGTPLALVGGSFWMAVAQTLFAPVLVVASTGTALGIGALIPRFERRELMNVERAHPSQMAVLGFFFGGIVVGAVGMGLLSWTLYSAGSVALALGAWTVYLTLLGGGAVGGYWYAVRKLDQLTLDDM